MQSFRSISDFPCICIFRQLCIGNYVKVIHFFHCGNIYCQVHRHLTQTCMRMYSENWNGACAEGVVFRVELVWRYLREGRHNAFYFGTLHSFLEFERICCKCFRLCVAWGIPFLAILKLYFKKVLSILNNLTRWYVLELIWIFIMLAETVQLNTCLFIENVYVLLVSNAPDILDKKYHSWRYFNSI